MTRRLAVLAMLGVSTAHAEPPPKSYRAQTIAVDAAAAGAIALGMLEAGKADTRGTVGGVILAAGITTYFVGAPIVHRVHGNPVLRSIAIRVAPVAIGFGIAGLADDCEGGHECAFAGLAQGAASLLLTVPAALAIEWLVFSIR